METRPELELEPEPEPEPELVPGYGDEDNGVAAGVEYDDDGVAADVEYDDDEEDDGRHAVEETWSSDSGGGHSGGLDESDLDGDSGVADYGTEGASDRWSRRAAVGPEPPASLCCPVTLMLLSDPVTIADGHTYERRALTEWFDRGHRSSPVTRKRLASREMHTNFLARQAVESYQQKISGNDSPAKPTPPSRTEVLDCVDRCEDERTVDTGEIRRRNRRTRRAAAWDEQINHIENWIATVDPASGQTYYYNRLTRVTQWEDPSADTGKVGSATSGEVVSTTARPVTATHPGMAAFPGMKPVETGAPAGKGPAYGLCVWLSAVILLAASGATVALAVWLAGVWPDAAAPPQDVFAAAAACVVMQAGLFVGKPRKRLGQTLGTVVLVASSVFNTIFVLAGVSAAVDMWVPQLAEFSRVVADVLLG